MTSLGVTSGDEMSSGIGPAGAPDVGICGLMGGVAAEPLEG